jgi:hypothetical protein
MKIPGKLVDVSHSMAVDQAVHQYGGYNSQRNDAEQDCRSEGWLRYGRSDRRNVGLDASRILVGCHRRRLRISKDGFAHLLGQGAATSGSYALPMNKAGARTPVPGECFNQMKARFACRIWNCTGGF